MSGIQTKVAAGFALVALGSIAGYAAGGDEPAQVTAAKQPVEVRTQTIRRTIRVVKHEKPRHAPSQPLESAAPSAPARVRPVAAVPRVAPAAPPPRRSTPVRTRTSGSGPAARGEREHESEHAAEREVGDD